MTMNDELLEICQFIEDKIARAPGINFRSLDDDGGHGNSHHILKLLQNHTQSISSCDQQRILQEFCETGPLIHLIDDQTVTEILINGQREIWYEKVGKLERLPDNFFSAFTYENFVQKIFCESGVHIDLRRPAVDGNWLGFRFHAIGVPLSLNGTILTLRRHPENPWTIDELCQAEWASRDVCHRLESLVTDNESLLIAGTTGSGKTSILSACLQNIRTNERAIILEDTKEIALPNQISLRLLTRSEARSELPDYSLSDLVRQSLRMRPDRLIMGEIRGPEAKDLLLSLSTGHKGAMATIHARSPHEALMRLEILIQLGAPMWRTETVRKLIFHGLQYIILTQRENHQRRFAGAYRISSLESSGFLLDREF
jgi:pilus assembly protein CpaF